jgi:hypothetical protein
MFPLANFSPSTKPDTLSWQSFSVARSVARVFDADMAWPASSISSMPWLV